MSEDGKNSLQSSNDRSQITKELTAETAIAERLTSHHIDCFTGPVDRPVLQAILKNPTLTDELYKRLMMIATTLHNGMFSGQVNQGFELLKSAYDSGLSIPLDTIESLTAILGTNIHTSRMKMLIHTLCYIGKALSNDTWSQVIDYTINDRHALLEIIRCEHTPSNIFDQIEKQTVDSIILEAITKKKANIDFVYEEEVSEESEIACPFCGAVEECSHLLAVIESPECYGGAIFERYSELGEIAQKNFFRAYKSGIGPNHTWKNTEIDELWYGSMDFSNSGPEYDEEIDLDWYVLPRIIMDIFLKMGASVQSLDIERGPGLSSTYHNYYLEDADKKVDLVFDTFQAMFDEGVE